MNLTQNIFENFYTRKVVTYLFMLFLFIYIFYLSIANVVKYSSSNKVIEVSSQEIQDFDAPVGSKISTQIIIKKSESFESALKKYNINVSEIIELKKILRQKKLIKKIPAQSIIEMNLLVNHLSQGGLNIVNATIYNPDHVSIIKITKDNSIFSVEELANFNCLF